MKNRSNTNKVLLILVIILSILVVVLTTILCTTILVKPNKSTNEQKEILPKEIKDIDIITELSSKIDTLLHSTDGLYHQSNSTYGFLYRYKLLKNKITALDKQNIVLANINWDDMDSSTWEQAKNNEHINKLISDYSEEFLTTSTKVVSAEKVNVYSKELFKEEISNPIEVIYSCPIYIYDKETKLYYKPAPQCGGTITNMVKSYKSKYEENGTETHVYVSFAYLATSGTNSVLDTYTVYKDFDYSETETIKYKNSYKTGLKEQEAKDFKLDSTNYEEFSEYKFTFKKAKDNNYYFVNVEQIK